MNLIVAIVASVALMGLSVLLHYAAISLTRQWLAGSELARHWGVLAGMGILSTAQILTVCLYALAYSQLVAVPGMGTLEGQVEGIWLDYFYFSIMSYTTLGVGDIYPSGTLRVMSGLQALNGFALIGWTASFAYALIREGWN